MKKIFSIFLAFAMCFSLVACSNDKSETENNKRLNAAPILGVEIRDEESAGFYALTKNGTYTWTVTHENGETEQTIYDGYFCLESENLCTFTREETGGSITLKFTGSVLSYEIYCAEKAEIENDKTKIINEKYLVDKNSEKITFPESGEYYYVVNVNYDQGEVPYGFSLTE